MATSPPLRMRSVREHHNDCDYPFNDVSASTITAAKGNPMLAHTDYPLAGTGYRYTVLLQRPPFARGNTYCVFATLTALTHPLHPPVQAPSLDAWGKHEFDAQENLEGEMRAWLASPDAGRR